MESATTSHSGKVGSNTRLFLLSEIASWTPGVCEDTKAKDRARIPALQRGLVWSPQQNELLWDSILRGFPIGAIVLAKYSERLKKATDLPNEGIQYHLLDGQQRCNAITMGYIDPFSSALSPDAKEVDSILWLDLNPSAPPNSTRKFWVRVTTTAHPWGYSRNDAATPLSASAIRGALEKAKPDPAGSKNKRPSARQLWPAEAAANTPVPLSWLMHLPLDCERSFWEKLRERARNEAGKFPWASDVGAWPDEKGPVFNHPSPSCC